MPHTVRIIDNDSPLRQLLSNSQKLKGAYVKVGYPAEAELKVAKKDKVRAFAKLHGIKFKSTSANKSNSATSMSELATVATTHELGSVANNIPARPPVRPAIDKNRVPIAQLQVKLVDKIFAGKISVEKALGILGEFLVSLIKKEITALVSPPLSPKTIKRKKSSKPLIDKGQMRNSVTYVRKHK